MGEIFSSFLDLNLWSVSSICLSFPFLKNEAIEIGNLSWKNFHAMDAACKSRMSLTYRILCFLQTGDVWLLYSRFSMALRAIFCSLSIGLR